MAVDPKELAERFPALTENMADEEIVCMAARLERKTMLAGHVLLEQGQPTDTLYLVRRGVLGVLLTAGEETLELGQVATGAWVGEMGFIHPGPAAAHVRVLEDCELWSVDHEQMEALRREDPGCVNDLLEVINNQLADRLRSSQSGALTRDKEGHTHLVKPRGQLKRLWRAQEQA